MLPIATLHLLYTTGGYSPFYAKSTRCLFRSIVKADYHFHSKFWGHVSVEAKNFIRCMLQADPARRWTAAQLLRHPWIVNHTADSPHRPALVQHAAAAAAVAAEAAAAAASSSASAAAGSCADCSAGAGVGAAPFCESDSPLPPPPLPLLHVQCTSSCTESSASAVSSSSDAPPTVQLPQPLPPSPSRRGSTTCSSSSTPRRRSLVQLVRHLIRPSCTRSTAGGSAPLA
jgi:serine/threonine protein kinase